MGPLAFRNEAVQRLRRLASSRRARRDEACFVVEGPTLVAEALAAGAEVQAIFYEPGSVHEAHLEVIGLAADRGVDLVEVQDGVLARACDAVTPQPVAALVSVRRFELAELVDRPGPLVVCAGLQDPGNAGAIVRSAWAAGASGAVFCEGSVDVYNPKAVRASAGGLFWLPVVTGAPPAQLVDDLHRGGVRILAAVPSGGGDYLATDLTGATALVFGAEAAGLPPDLAAGADALVSIGMGERTESLNVAMAATVLCFEARRQRLADQGDPVAAAARRVDVMSAVSHELRSPLTSIKGFSALLLDRWGQVGDEDRLAMINQIHHDAGRVSRLMAELLDVSRIEAGGLVLHRRCVRLADLAGSAVRAASAEFTDIDAELDFPADLPDPFADPDRIEQVLANLVENACKYASPKGLRIHGATCDGAVSVTVADSGHGIPASDLPSIFDKHFRSSSARPSGCGLGLWISRNLVEAHGGRLTARSNAGHGAAFRFTLPLFESDLPPDHDHT